jgi:aspartate/tyrosine/aromatic aminotransferase
MLFVGLVVVGFVVWLVVIWVATAPQVKLLVEKYHIYLLANGRISMAGIKPKDCKYLADAIHDAVTSIPSK